MAPLYTYTFEAYDPEAIKRAEKDLSLLPPSFLFFQRMHDAFFARTLDERSGRLKALVPLGDDVEKMEAARDLLKFFRTNRVENPDIDRRGYMPDPKGFVFEGDLTQVNRLKEHWKGYKMTYCGDADIEMVDIVEAELKQLEESKREAEKAEAKIDRGVKLEKGAAKAPSKPTEPGKIDEEPS